jgi:glucokinase
MAGAAVEPTTWLVGDIGATHARFGLVTPDAKLLQSRTLPDEDYATIEDAIGAFLAERGALPMPRRGAIAIASPIAGDRVEMTNHPWSFSIRALGQRFAFERLEVINDFTALALALPHLRPEDRLAVGGGTAIGNMPIAVLGPGSGLGVSGLVPSKSGWIALAGEGGHATMAPATDRESAVIDRMRRHFDHVSAERALSGPGLFNLYKTLAALDGIPAKGYTAAQITDLAIRGEDPLCVETTLMFCAMLGTTPATWR